MKERNDIKSEAILYYINKRKVSLLEWYRKAIEDGDEKQADLYQELMMELDSIHELILRMIRT